MSARIQSVLKRPEEGELIRTAHLKPLFAEDVVREMAKNFITREFPILDEADIIFKVETLESIHPYNVYCELKRKYGELKNKIL
ncbi:MAG: GTP cyclohydrolase, FolE2/MptA family, partial [Promethearchaeota archaeon]